MKIPKTLMQAVEELNIYQKTGFTINDLILRRSQPFTPKILEEYGFKESDRMPDEKNQIYEKDRLFIEIGYYFEYKRGYTVFTFPAPKTIDDFENDLARVMETIG